MITKRQFQNSENHLWRTRRRSCLSNVDERMFNISIRESYLDFVNNILLGHCKPFSVLQCKNVYCFICVLIPTSCGVNLVISLSTVEWALQSINTSVSGQTTVQSAQ